jgi:hypothetical protein
MRTIAAQDATVGATYRNARGTLVTVTEIPPDPAQVAIRLASGTPTTVPRAYPLELVNAPPGPEVLAHGPIDAIRAAVVAWEVEDLEDLSDLDQRPEVQDLIRLELGKRQAPDERIAPPVAPKPAAVVDALNALAPELLEGTRDAAPPAPPPSLLTCGTCGTETPALVSASGPARVGVHASPTTGVYCTGSACPPKAEPSPEAVAEAAGAQAFRSGRYGSFAEAQAAPELRDFLADPFQAGWEAAEAAEASTAPPVAPPVTTVAPQVPEVAPEAAPVAAPVAAAPEIPKAANDRIKLIRAFTTPAQVEAAKAWPSYQAPSLDPEVKAQAARLVEVDAARLAGNLAELQRLAGIKAVEIRPGVMAMIRKAIAELQGAGADVTPSARQVDPTELAPLPLTVTPEDRPEDLAETLAELVKVTRIRAWSTEVVILIRDVLSNVRDSRAALQRTEDVATLRLAWRLELISRRRVAILDQLRARVVALGGAEVIQEDLVEQLATGEIIAPSPAAVEAEPAPELGAPPARPVDGSEREAVDPDGDLAEAEGLAAFKAGAMVTANPYADPFYSQAWEIGWVAGAGDAEPPELQAPPAVELPPEPERIDTLPLVDQVAKASTARALELVADLPVAQLGEAYAAEIERAEPRDRVIQAIRDRGFDLGRPVATAPELQPELPPAPVKVAPPKAKAGPPLTFQVQDLQLHQLPDGTEDLWAHAPGHRPALVGKVGDPKIAQVVELYRRHLAETGRTPPPPNTAAGRAEAAADAKADPMAQAQATLSALAAGLPALAALGLDVTITITTRPRA